MIELRCDAKKHGVLYDHVVEVKCNSKFCGASSGIVVLHKFNTETGELIETNLYKDPTREK